MTLDPHNRDGQITKQRHNSLEHPCSPEHLYSKGAPVVANNRYKPKHLCSKGALVAANNRYSSEHPCSPEQPYSKGALLAANDRYHPCSGEASGAGEEPSCHTSTQ